MQIEQLLSTLFTHTIFVIPLLLRKLACDSIQSGMFSAHEYM